MCCLSERRVFFDMVSTKTAEAAADWDQVWECANHVSNNWSDQLAHVGT